MTNTSAAGDTIQLLLPESFNESFIVPEINKINLLKHIILNEEIQKQKSHNSSKCLRVTRRPSLDNELKMNKIMKNLYSIEVKLDIIQRCSKFQYFDDTTMALYNVPHKVTEAAYCRDLPTPTLIPANTKALKAFRATENTIKERNTLKEKLILKMKTSDDTIKKLEKRVEHQKLD